MMRFQSMATQFYPLQKCRCRGIEKTYGNGGRCVAQTSKNDVCATPPARNPLRLTYGRRVQALSRSDRNRLHVS